MCPDRLSVGFEFTRDLCGAIESYTGSVLRKNPKAYEYRGMCLQHAVERSLYVRCVNSEALMGCYLFYRKGIGVRGDNYQISGIESDILFFLCGVRGFDRSISVSLIQGLFGVVGRALRWFRRSCSGVLISRNSLRHHDVIINVINGKFVKYLNPVTEQLSSTSYAYLKTSRSTCDFGNNQICYYSLKGLKAFDYIFCPPALSGFSEILYDADEIVGSLQILRPNCAVVVEGNAYQDVVTSEACRLLEIPCFCIQQGWSPYIHTGFRNMSFSEMFVWGNRFAEMLRVYNPNQIFTVTGSHAIQLSDLMVKSDFARAIGFFCSRPARF